MLHINVQHKITITLLAIVVFSCSSKERGKSVLLQAAKDAAGIKIYSYSIDDARKEARKEDKPILYFFFQGSHLVGDRGMAWRGFNSKNVELINNHFVFVPLQIDDIEYCVNCEEKERKGVINSAIQRKLLGHTYSGSILFLMDRSCKNVVRKYNYLTLEQPDSLNHFLLSCLPVEAENRKECKGEIIGIDDIDFIHHKNVVSAKKHAAKENKLILLFFFQNSHLVSNRSEVRKIFRDPKIQKIIDEKYALVLMQVDDFENQEGTSLTQGELHQKLQISLTGKNTTPTFVVLDSSGEVVKHTDSDIVSTPHLLGCFLSD